MSQHDAHTQRQKLLKHLQNQQPYDRYWLSRQIKTTPETNKPKPTGVEINVSCSTNFKE